MIKRTSGFTLIEVLITASIVAILVSIALPNFLEAQIRAKTSRARSDLRSMATALEAYRADQNQYPVCAYGFANSRYFPQAQQPLLPLYVLTTPISYIANLPKEVFPNHAALRFYPIQATHYRYYSPWWEQAMIADHPLLILDQQPISSWALVSSGPDQAGSGGQWLVFGLSVMVRASVAHDYNAGQSIYPGQKASLYDPTNGTVSFGDIVRIAP